MSEIKTLSEVMQQEQEYRKNSRIAKSWKSLRPEGSNWYPGDIGDPACQDCKGPGYLHLDLPIAHPEFGKLVLCDCVQTVVVK